MKNYDIHNPTRAARVIYDGIDHGGGNQREIHIVPGATKLCVALSDDIAQELRNRTRGKDASGKSREDADLQLTLSDVQPETTDDATKKGGPDSGRLQPKK